MNLKGKQWMGVVTFTCNPATLEAEFCSVVYSVSVGGRWVDCVTTCNPAQGEKPD